MVANDVKRRKLIFRTVTCVRACVRAYVRTACVRACIRACVRACVRTCVRGVFSIKIRLFERILCLTCSVSISFGHNYNMNELDLCF